VDRRRKRVLVIEDHDDLRSFFCVALTIAGYDVAQAGDGVQAIQQLEGHPPDLVVLDLRLPMFNGVEVRQDLAANVLTRDIPVVVVSGSPEDLGDLKVDCLLKKPVTAETLVAAVQRCLAAGARSSRL
jgi:twitching motility two-component system response regulator PilH